MASQVLGTPARFRSLVDPCRARLRPVLSLPRTGRPLSRAKQSRQMRDFGRQRHHRPATMLAGIFAGAVAFAPAGRETWICSYAECFLVRAGIETYRDYRVTP